MSYKKFLNLKKQQRRDFLIGTGTIIALPFLESLYPKNLYAQTNVPLRCVFGFLEGGVEQNHDKGEYAPQDVLNTLNPVSNYLNIYKNITCKNAGRSGNPHPLYIKYFTSAYTGTSFDVHLSKLLKSSYGNSTKNNPLNFSFNIRHTTTANWFNITQEQGSYYNMTSSLIDLQKKSMKLASSDDPIVEIPVGTQKTFFKKSLDYVVENIKEINRKLSPTDKIILDKHLEGINQIYNLEEKTQEPDRTMASATTQTCKTLNIAQELSGLDWKQRHEIAADIIASAIICDSQRLFTIMNGDGHGNKVDPKHENYSPAYRILKNISGKSYDYHKTTHLHSTESDVVKKISDQQGVNGRDFLRTVRKEIDVIQVGFYSRIAQKLAQAQDTNGKSVLENSLIYLGADMGDATSHKRSDVFTATIGGAGGKIKSGNNNLSLNGCEIPDFQAGLIKALGHNQNIYGGKNNGAKVNSVVSALKA